MFDFLSRPMDTRQTTRMALMAIILLTLPCYCLGMVLLALAPSGGKSTPAPTNPTLSSSTLLPALTATFTPFRTATPLGGPLGPTPPQLWLPTNTPFFFPTSIPTWTPISYPTLTTAPSLTPSPTLFPTQVPTATLVPTDVPLPTATEAPLPTEPPLPTDVPPATEPPLPTDEPPPTQETF